MSMSVTIEDLRALVPGQTIVVKVADADGIKQDARGQEFICIFKELIPNDSWAGEDVSDWLLCADRADGGAQYRFHGWLIESIEVMT